MVLMAACATMALWFTSCGTGGSTALISASTAGIFISPATVLFGDVSVGTASAAKTITLTSSGSGTLTISSITASGDFAQTNNCGTSVAAGENCTVSVIFTPAATGTRSGTLSISDDAAGSPDTVTLTGTGAVAAPAVTPSVTDDDPVVSLAPTSLTFASQAVGTTSVNQAITLTNTGNASLSLTSISVKGANAGDFAQTNTCGSSVAAGGKCTISVTFTPAASGSRSAALSIADNASGSPQTVSLTGTGTAPVASVSPTSLTFSSQAVDTTSSAQTVTLTNSGNAALSITSLTFTGTNASDFAHTDTCGTSVAAGANCTIAVLFTPSASGARTAALSIADNATGSPQTVSLSGTGSHDVILSWTASATTGVTGYYIYRGTTSGGESSTPLNPTSLDGTRYTDESVTAGTKYYYVVKAVASNGVTLSAASNEASATVP